MKINAIQNIFRYFLQSTRSRKINISLDNSVDIQNLLQVLQRYGYIIGYSLNTITNRLDVYPRYRVNGSSYLNDIDFYADLRVFCNYGKLFRLSKRCGSSLILIYNPIVGIVSHDVALVRGLGGYLLCKLY